YTPNPKEGWNDIVVKLPLILVPLSVGTSAIMHAERQKKLLHFFALSCSVAGLYLLAHAYVQYLGDGNIYHFSHHNLMVFKRVPVHYFSLYSNVAFFCMLYYMVTGWKKASSFYRFTAVFCCLILPSLILLSAARIQFIGFATGLFLLFLWVALRKR